MTIRISRRAQTDLHEIREFTIGRWGQDQWLKYYRGLASAMERIGATPMCGQDRTLFKAGMRSLSYERHLLFFEQIDDVAVILRIIH